MSDCMPLLLGLRMILPVELHPPWRRGANNVVSKLDRKDAKGKAVSNLLFAANQHHIVWAFLSLWNLARQCSSHAEKPKAWKIFVLFRPMSISLAPEERVPSMCISTLFLINYQHLFLQQFEKCKLLLNYHRIPIWFIYIRIKGLEVFRGHNTGLITRGGNSGILALFCAAWLRLVCKCLS